MKTVKVLYFASLRERLGKSEEIIELDNEVTAIEVWKLLNSGAILPDACLVAINQEYAELSSEVKAGDELAFFPPVTGG